MSRTYKDKPYKFKYDAWDKDIVKVEYFYRIYLPTTKPKKRKAVDTEHHWMSTPSWWNHLFHTKPIRINFRTFLSNAKKSSINDLNLLLEPLDSNKPHKYFW